MKYFIAFLLAVVVVGCSKNNTCKDNPALIGDWELRKSEGGIAGTINYPLGNGNILRFKLDQTFEQIVNNNIVNTGPYAIWHSQSADQWLLEMSGVTSQVKLKENNLVFIPTETCCDQPIVTYARFNINF